jgi:hypothetical protein
MNLANDEQKRKLFHDMNSHIHALALAIDTLVTRSEDIPDEGLEILSLASKRSAELMNTWNEVKSLVRSEYPKS